MTTTTGALVATGFVVGRLWPWLAGAILCVLMMLSRTYLGVHWLSDTVAGVLLGAGAVILLWSWFQDKCLPEYNQVEALKT